MEIIKEIEIIILIIVITQTIKIWKEISEIFPGVTIQINWKELWIFLIIMDWINKKKKIIIQIIIQIKTLEVFLNQTKIIIVFLQMLLVIIHALQIAKMVLLLIMKKELSKLKKIKI